MYCGRDLIELHRPELIGLGEDAATNRFLNWVRLRKASGDDWETTPVLDAAKRTARLQVLGPEWLAAEDNAVPATYGQWLEQVQAVFGDNQTLKFVTREELTRGLLSLHAFTEQLRWVNGGKMAEKFWDDNANDLTRVKNTLIHLLYGPGDYVERLEDALYDPRFKLRNFAMFCCLELMGTVKPTVVPPINGRIAKALRYIGYNVQPNSR